VQQRKVPVPEGPSINSGEFTALHEEQLSRKLEAKMAELEEQRQVLEQVAYDYQQLIQGIDDIVYRTDAQLCWSLLNPAWTGLLGYTLDESLTKPFIDFVYEEDRGGCLEYLNAVLRGNEISETRAIRFLDKAG